MIYLVSMHDFLSCIHYNTTVVLCNVTIRIYYINFVIFCNREVSDFVDNFLCIN